MASSRGQLASVPGTPAPRQRPQNAVSPSPLPLTRGVKRKTLSPAQASSWASNSPAHFQRSTSTSTSATPASQRDNAFQGRAKRPRRSDVHDGCSPHAAGDVDIREEQDHFNAMAEEKKLFPGSTAWAEDELHLFEILYMRQYSPLLPRQWDMNFRGIPIPGVLFSTSDIEKPVIFSQSDNDFKATKALIQLIELTSNVRSLMQSGQKDRVSACIRKELEDYARWAAQDGGFDNLDIIPNVIIDVVDTTIGSARIEEYMQQRLRTLAARHREYWRINNTQQQCTSLAAPVKRETDATCEPNTLQELASPIIIKREDEKAETIHFTYPETQMPTIGSRYVQQPPVIYGMFIVNATVMVLSIDSAKEGDSAHVSYQVEVGFSVKNQGVWNAITVAIIICLARDHMMTLTSNFVQLVDDPDSDPDA